MQTAIYDADEFSGTKGKHYVTIDSDYRWEKGDEIWLETADERVKLRITWVVVTISESGVVTRELLGLKL